MTKMDEFRFATGPEPHRARTKAILQKYPQVKLLIGKNPLTILSILALVTGMVVGAYLVRNSSWWIIIASAYFIGAFFNHALFVMIHECTHNLLFKRKSWNNVAAIFANLPHILPSAISFGRYHLNHHAFQGVHEMDADLPGHWEAKLISHSFFGKALWLLFFPLFQVFRTARLKEIQFMDGWIFTNLVVQLAFNIAIYVLIGPKAFFFLLISFFFSVGLHPLGARWVQEHYLTLDEKQETFSYYGPLNALSFNVGYHNEHHDFPSIPWNKLPDLKKQAPDYYDSLKAHTSWTKLFLQFLFDNNISLYMRILRNDRNNVKLKDKSSLNTEMEVMDANP